MTSRLRSHIGVLSAVNLLFVCATHLAGQSKEEKPIVLTHADSLVGKVVNGETVREVSGNVEFVQENVVVRCDRAVHYPGRNYAELYGHISLIRDTVTLTAPRGTYSGEKRQAFGFDGVRLWNKRVALTAREGEYLVDEKTAYFKKQVKVVDSTTTITGDELTYYEKEHKSIVTGDVKVVNSRDNTTMYGRFLEHLDDRKYSKMLQAPKFVQVDTSSSGKIDTLVIISREMESYEDSLRRFIAIDSVQLVRGDLSGKCGMGVYYPDKDVVDLRMEPIIWYEESQVTGDSVYIQLRKRRLDRVFVYGNAYAISQSDSLHENRFDQMTSQKMILYFSDSKLDHIEAEGTAVSLYFLYDQGVPNGVNKASGDRIFVYSRNGRAESIKVVGGTEGKYYPENLVAGSEESYNLLGFRWRTDRPKVGNDFNIVVLPIEKNERTRLEK
ncbi:MAG: OstA-like protein [Bacteroidota bacterium]